MPTNLDLLSLDAADAALDPSQRLRADAMLERIIAAPVTPEHAPVGARRQQRFSRKLIWVPVVAVAVAVGSIVIPPGRGGGSATAYASWTSTPSAVAAGDLEAVTQACRDYVAEQFAELGDHGPRFDAATIPVAIAERRGDFVAVLLQLDNPDYSVSCVATNRPGSSDVDDLSAAAGGSDGPAPIPPAGRITQGGSSQFGDQPGASVSFTSGLAGAGVVGVTIHAGPQVITATVKNGRYVAWWPGKAFADGPQQPSGQGGPAVILTYDVTLTDGTTKTNVSPALPA
jgi:hypothetical protein